MRGSKGFTLVEVMVSVAILTLLIAGTYAILNIGNTTYFTDICLLDLHQGARQSMYYMVKEVRQAKAGDVNIVALDADDDQITFNTPDEDGIQYYRDLSDVNGDGIVKQIIREYPAGTYKILASDISSLRFIRDNYLLEIQLIADRTASGRNLSFPLTVKARLRNE